MKKVVIAILALLCASSAFAEGGECSSIKQDKQRLACFDKAAGAKTPPSPATSSGQPNTSRKFHSGPWFVDESIDTMTDKKRCTALYKNDWTIQGVSNNLFVSLKGRGGVQGYTLRFDNDPADEMQFASSTEKDISAIILGYNFERATKAKRLRIQINTLVSGIVVEDIDLAGFSEAVNYMKDRCQG
jgi:hypothetical protein